METALRWSPKSNASEQRLLLVDVVGRSFKLCRVTSYKDSQISYNVISTHTKVPAFRAFDWNPSNEALVAVGQSSGEATVLRIDDGSQDTISLPIRNQRYCNAVAFNTQGLLAAGLDKVRNDFCLNVWDLNQRVSTASPRGLGPDRQTTEPIRKLASSEPIMSVKFFSDRPDQLVAGVKAQFVRIYDLRGWVTFGDCILLC
jgi:WD repeat-containing protein mio